MDAKGLPALPTTTPHMMRRTCISLALLGNGSDVKWVMSQVGHADSKMTLDLYAQLEQRVDRSHETAFDALVRRAAAMVATTSAQRELELSADLDELRQPGCQLDGIAVWHELGTAFEDGDAALVVEVGAERHAGVSAREQCRPMLCVTMRSLLPTCETARWSIS
jgi:hypothetical protein